MQTANQVLTAIRKLGEKRLPLTRVYRCLFHEDLFLLAYSNLSRNKGALTPGTDDDTVDGMSLDRIRTLITALRQERFSPRPARRTHIPKRDGGQRPLGMPNFSEKLVQEVLRLLLSAYYEPRFRDSSHGFRRERGCHTALQTIKHTFGGSTWFIEGDIRGAFDNLDHTVLLTILARDIKDGRLLTLIRRHLTAGVFEHWQYHATYSGTPQGGVLSPLLSNIYFHTLDEFIEDILIPANRRGKQRRVNLAYKRLSSRIEYAHQHGNHAITAALKQQRRTLPASDMYDPGFRRLRYIRYADDFILGFIGPKAEALAIKEQLRVFLRDELKLDLHPEKTRITHAGTEHAQFLGYAVSVYHVDDKMTRRLGHGAHVRSINGKVRLGIPSGRIAALTKPYYAGTKVISVRYMVRNTVENIIQTFQARYRGIVEYYKFAVDRTSLNTLKHVMEMALVKTLAHKLRIRVSKVYRKYRATTLINGQRYRVLQATVETPTGPHHFTWGGISLAVVKTDTTAIIDRHQHYTKYQYFEKHTDVVRRLLANCCELCGATTSCEVHHIRKVTNLRTRWAGRKTKPWWVVQMIALARKTLVVCKPCHRAIHTGQYLPRRPE